MWDVFSVIILIAGMMMAVAGIVASLYLLIIIQPIAGRIVSLRSFVALLMTYVTVMMGFGIMYLCLELLGLPILITEALRDQMNFFQILEEVMYFSAVTLLTVGYGDITPDGIGRWIAMIEALIGYLLPAAFVVTTVFYRARELEGL